MLAHEVLPHLVRLDAAAPRVTYYDDTDEPTRGERIELSGKVLTNWVSKAGNLLLEEFDVAPGSTVALDLPPEHWRTVYWAAAVWQVGGAVVADTEGADVVVSTRPDAAAPSRLVLVTLAALARAHDGEVPPGAVDEATEVATYADHLDVLDEPEASDPALRTEGNEWSFATVVEPAAEPERRLARGDLGAVLRTTLAAWSAGGSVLLCRGSDAQTLADRMRVEGATPEC